MSLDVLGLINESRMTYGLRHQDYLRYREYCANRVRRLRQILKLSQPNNKNVNVTKPLPEEFQDNRYLQLYVFEAERAWAYAMELKQESTNSMETRQKHHLIKRLRRSSQHALKLVELCEKQTVDSKTVFDVKAYAVLMKGYLFFEQQKWKEALDQLIEARTIYEKFAQYNNNAQQEALYYAAMDEIDPNVRFCAYRLQLDTQDAESIAKTHPRAHSLGEELLKMGQESAWKGDTMEWRGRELTVKSQGLSEAVRKAQQENVWTESEKMVKKALKEAKEASAKVTSSRSEKTVNDLNYLFTWVEYSTFASVIQRNLQSISENEGKHQHIIKLYDEILKNMEYIWELPFVRDDIQFDTELSALALYYRGCRSVEIALVYNEMDKVPESLALYERAQGYAVQAKQALGQLNEFSKDAVIQVSEQELTQLEQTIRTGTWKSRAAWHLEHESEGVTDQMKQLNINNDYLIDHLDTYPGHIDRLVQFPPAFQPISCKPFYFDLAANHIKYPEQSLEERTEKSASSGLWGLFGKRW
ncbi:signal recognition particle subunit srp68 [Rhizopus stolonifer]|uniref:Signal recognition particle subunit SRP68 n=1 Tax=Rhizopus stolonifer TaxID=4846 RepID=A0A367IVJ2_RHIST|nr:signal recognition particle subunit srp68 [Rhizopus stolonifer]